MKKRLLIVLSLSFLLYCFVSCDNRQDLYEKHNRQGVIYLSPDEDFSHLLESFEDTMYFGDTFEFFYKIEDDFYGESTLEAEVYSIGSQTPLYDTLSTGEANFVELISFVLTVSDA